MYNVFLMYYYQVYFSLCLPVSVFVLSGEYVCPATNPKQGQ